MLKIKTKVIKKLVAKAEQGATNEKLLPLTSLLCIQAKDGTVVMSTTDSSNTLVVSEKVEEQEDFYAVIPVDVFSKLMQRTTSEFVKLDVNEDSLIVQGNGKHTIPLVIDEGGVVKFPEVKAVKGEVEVIKISDIKNVISVNSASLAKTYDIRCLCSYYAGDVVVTSDDQAACINEVKLFKKDSLISERMMKLLSLVEEDTVDCVRNGKMFYFTTPTFFLAGPEADGIEDFPYEQLMEYVEEEFPSKCNIKKSDLLDVIKRLELFIEPYDKNGANLEFTQDDIIVTSKRSSSEEFVEYRSVEYSEGFKCCVDVPMLRQQIEAIQEDSFEIAFGNETAIRLQSNGVNTVISLLEED